MSKRILISELEPNQLIEGVYAIHNCQLGMTRGGKPFLKCLLADKSARTPGRMWNASEELFSTLSTDGFVFIEGQTQPYQGEMQIIIKQIAPAQPSEVDLLDLLPCTKQDVKEMFDQVKAIMRTISNQSILALAKQYLDDEELMAQFQRAPAAMTLHHAYLGGLLEHTLALLKLAEVFCPLYPQLNRDMVLMGIFIHDMGKCSELTWETGFGYSEDGHLVGHIARGIIWLDQKVSRCAQAGSKISEPIVCVLHHMILSHHGKAEFGALKIPATPEAIAVSLLDNIDAKMHMALSAARGDQVKSVELGGHFTEKIWALETRLYRPDPTTLGG